MTGYYHTNILPWTIVPEENRVFRAAVQIALAIYVVLAVAASVITVPKVERSRVQDIPPQLAKLILEREKPKPLPPKIEEVKEDKAKAEDKKKEEKKAEKKEEKKVAEEKKEPKPLPKEEPKPEVVPQIDRVAEARKKAASTGLLALSDELADLRETPVAAKLGAGAPLSKGVQQAQPVGHNILTSGTSSSGGINTGRIGSGGIDTSGLGSGVGRSELAGRSTTKVESPVEMVAAKASQPQAVKTNGAKPSRTYEEVSLVFDKNKGAIYSLYSRALRQDPTLQGKVVLEITIDASGHVIDCKIVSSELNNPELESKLISRVKLLSFGERDVEVLVVTYPIDFLPS